MGAVDHIHHVPEAEDTLMMRPYFCWRITGQAALVTLYVPGSVVSGCERQGQHERMSAHRAQSASEDGPWRWTL